ncbi:MAG: asparagine synthase (glutamine-hydrolyzing) [Proteobacteria bacterium]|nr:asparagine synthase (glutamine-hydrolyzing) [Pseudomonadota bacterium]
MCGIAGIYSPQHTNPVNENLLTEMASVMFHRGPDDGGTFVSADGRLGFGFRRLSIVDLSQAGHQPMCNEDGSVWIVFNGEIYNHQDLRRQLQENGHRFKSSTDTESIIHGYEQWGREVVQHLRGMFAFAIWDSKNNTLFLARDHIGIKPLYYSQMGGRFCFASEIKSLLTLPWIKREVDQQALGLYLTFSAVPAPRTMFKGIKKLPPGHTMTIDQSLHCRSGQYWRPLFPDDPKIDLPEEQCAEQLRAKLQESISLRMMSDVPFGVFLSGGLDSSLNVALMSQLMDQPVDTFSVAIAGDPHSNELSQARRVADYFGTNHREILIDQSDFVSFLPEMAWHQDEPLADPVCVPLYYVSRLARESGTYVVQVGEGSDELFGGYNSYPFYQRMAPSYRALAALPAMLKTPLNKSAQLFLKPWQAEFVEQACSNLPFFLGQAIGFRPGSASKTFPLAGGTTAAMQLIRAIYQEQREAGGKAGLLNDIAYVELRHRLPELLLMRVDKMCMATSVEARVPYLDQEVVRFALSIPGKYKIKQGSLKHILKLAARGLVPDFVINRPKKGFCGSANNMVSGQVSQVNALLLNRYQDLNSLLDWSSVEKLTKFRRGSSSPNGFPLWVLLNLALWHIIWIQDVSPENLQTELEPLIMECKGACQ